jgi:hypothetical protein
MCACALRNHILHPFYVSASSVFLTHAWSWVHAHSLPPSPSTHFALPYFIIVFKDRALQY